MPSRHIPLEPEQEQLLVALVEAARSVPPDKREPFSALRGDDQYLIFHTGLPSGQRVQEQDVRTLAGLGLIASFRDTFWVTPLGFEYYKELKRGAGRSAKRGTRISTERAVVYTVGAVTAVVFVVSYVVQPLLPPTLNNALVQVVACFAGVLGVLAACNEAFQLVDRFRGDH